MKRHQRISCLAGCGKTPVWFKVRGWRFEGKTISRRRRIGPPPTSNLEPRTRGGFSTLLAFCIALSCAGPTPAFAAWVWSPHTGWVGPSGAVKDTPGEQLEHALGFFEARDYKQARREFQKLVKRYKDSREAAEAQYYIGRCHEAMDDGYAAFLAYRKTVQTYPSTTRFNECLERMMQIGGEFLSGKKRKLWGSAALLPARDKAVEIFQAIVEDGPFTSQGELAQYKLGLAHLALGEYEQAVSDFEQLIDRYPTSPLVDDSRFQLAQASLKGTFRPGYDQHPTDQAVRELETFVEEYPKSDLSPEALSRLQSLRERRAQHDYQVAQFYEQRRRPDSALVYYEGLARDYGTTRWGLRAVQRLQALQSVVK
ncbi:MAG: outer membrane protein assembly factor BamD [Candidatus Omnitrophica bacterium]|nr:outer membrane protein assembly factor BamD [Candidatus Omnitrophota bacterium]